MPNQYWTPEEAVVLVYFSSHGVTDDLVVDLIKLKCGTERSRRIKENTRKYPNEGNTSWTGGFPYPWPEDLCPT